MEEEEQRRLKKLIEDELFDVKLYEAILKYTKDKKERALLERLLEKERKDLEALRKLYPDIEPHLSKLKLATFLVLHRLFGTTFVIKFAELNEEEVLREYRRLLQEEENKEDRELLRKLIRSTKRYEYMLRSWLKDERLKYTSFVALGVVDGIISLVGTQAGFLGATGSSLFVGISTLIVGVATAVSMMAATFLQAKEMRNGVDPRKASAYAGVTYLAVTLALTAPYFVLTNPYVAFLLALFVSVVILATFTFYTSVVFERPFKEELLENLAVVALASGLGYGVGTLADAFLV